MGLYRRDATSFCKIRSLLGTSDPLGAPHPGNEPDRDGTLVKIVHRRPRSAEHRGCRLDSIAVERGSKAISNLRLEQLNRHLARRQAQISDLSVPRTGIALQ